VRTLVISDLHLGNRAGYDVLRRPAPRERLTEAVREIDRLVLLGDLAELATRTPGRSLEVAEPVLRAVASALTRDQEVIIVPGNHDRRLIRGWARAQGPRLSLDGSVPIAAAPALARVSSWFSPARVRVHYPGVWLGDGLYATHGHYLDRHLMPHAPVGLPRLSASARDERHVGAWDYEQRRIRARPRRERRAGPLSSALRMGAQAVSVLPQLLMRAGLTPVTAALLDAQMRHAALPALRTVLRRLGVEAETVIFGHVHRRGPLESEDADDWRADGGPQLFNTGSWMYQPPLLLDRARPPHPYWPGGAVRLETGRSPHTVGMLDDLDHDELWTPTRTGHRAVNTRAQYLEPGCRESFSGPRP
jgi:hypothetical protein